MLEPVKYISLQATSLAGTHAQICIRVIPSVGFELKLSIGPKYKYWKTMSSIYDLEGCDVIEDRRSCCLEAALSLDELRYGL